MHAARTPRPRWRRLGPSIGGIILFALLTALVGCGFFVDAQLTSITVTPTSPTVSIQATQQLTATGNFDDGSTEDMTNSVTWTSSDTNIATVSSVGVVTGVAAGTSTITATSGTLTATANVTVTAGTITAINITPANPTVAPGGTVNFTASATFSDGTTTDVTNSVTWNSSNTGIATINSSGVATGVALGTTNITATSGAITSNTAVLTVNQ